MSDRPRQFMVAKLHLRCWMLFRFVVSGVTDREIDGITRQRGHRFHSLTDRCIPANGDDRPISRLI